MYNENFLAAAISVGAGATLVNGVGFTSRSLLVEEVPTTMLGTISVTFTRAGGTAAVVTFNFQISRDNGATWTTAEYLDLAVPTNEDADANVVRKTVPVQLKGFTHMRLSSIVNSDGATALTAVNAALTRD